jgi:hypothetical protein
MTRRRTLLKGGLGLGIGLSFQVVPLGQDGPASVRPRSGDRLVRAEESSPMPLGPEDVPLGERPILAWAMDPTTGTVRSGSRLNRLLVLRLDPDSISPETKPRAAGGVLAYTAICPHTGCDVIDWIADAQLLQCPCHYSKFAARDGARVVDGPAPRALPALPLAIVDGKLSVASPFTARVTFEVA